MRAIPTLHEVDFGESVTWVPPAGAARYHVWIKTDSHTWFDDRDPSDMTYGGNSPRWAQVAGYDVENDVALDFPVAVAAKPVPNIEVTASGIEVGWQVALALFDGHDPEVMMVTALTPDARSRASTGTACRHRTTPTRAPSPRRKGDCYRPCSTSGRRSRHPAARRRSCRPKARGTS